MGTISTTQSRNTMVLIGNMRFKNAAAVPFRVWFSLLVSMIVLKAQHRRSVIRLSELTDDELRDVGITREQADQQLRQSYPLWYYDKPNTRHEWWR